MERHEINQLMKEWVRLNDLISAECEAVEDVIEHHASINDPRYPVPEIPDFLAALSRDDEKNLMKAILDDDESDDVPSDGWHGGKFIRRGRLSLYTYRVASRMLGITFSYIAYAHAWSLVVHVLKRVVRIELDVARH